MRRIVLVGGGHAHLEVLRSIARRPVAADVVLVSPSAQQLYSGMMPARLRGAVPERALAFDLPALCRVAGVRFVEAAAESVEATEQGGVVTLDGRGHDGHDGQAVEGDVISLDVGSVAAGLADTHGAARHALPVRPLDAWRALVRRADLLLAAESAVLDACVVGAGLGGVELALALQARAAGAGRTARITLVDAGPRMLEGWSSRAAGRVADLLARRGIRVREGVGVASVDADRVTLADGACLPSRLTLWVTGAAPHPLLGRSRLPRDARGFLHVDGTLRAVDGAAVWGAGDCIALQGAGWMPRSGVYAVRAAPVLADNLRRAAEQGDGAWRRFRPQRQALALVDTADGRALAYRHGLIAGGRWASWLKRWIDGRFVRRYQRLYERR